MNFYLSAQSDSLSVIRKISVDFSWCAVEFSPYTGLVYPSSKTKVFPYEINAIYKYGRFIFGQGYARFAYADSVPVWAVGNVYKKYPTNGHGSIFYTKLGYNLYTHKKWDFMVDLDFGINYFQSPVYKNKRFFARPEIDFAYQLSGSYKVFFRPSIQFGGNNLYTVVNIGIKRSFVKGMFSTNSNATNQESKEQRIDKGLFLEFSVGAHVTVPKITSSIYTYYDDQKIVGIPNGVRFFKQKEGFRYGVGFCSKIVDPRGNLVFPGYQYSRFENLREQYFITLEKRLYNLNDKTGIAAFSEFGFTNPEVYQNDYSFLFPFSFSLGSFIRFGAVFEKTFNNMVSLIVRPSFEFDHSGYSNLISIDAGIRLYLNRKITPTIDTSLLNRTENCSNRKFGIAFIHNFSTFANTYRGNVADYPVFSDSQHKFSTFFLYPNNKFYPGGGTSFELGYFGPGRFRQTIGYGIFHTKQSMGEEVGPFTWDGYYFGTNTIRVSDLYYETDFMIVHRQTKRFHFFAGVKINFEHRYIFHQSYQGRYDFNILNKLNEMYFQDKSEAISLLVPIGIGTNHRIYEEFGIYFNIINILNGNYNYSYNDKMYQTSEHQDSGVDGYSLTYSPWDRGLTKFNDSSSGIWRKVSNIFFKIGYRF